jgi:hypothetical protein
MTKSKKAASEREVIFGRLAEHISMPNGLYSPAVESNRIDACEMLLKHAGPDYKELALDFLRDVMNHRHANIGKINESRACKLLLEYLPVEVAQ